MVSYSVMSDSLHDWPASAARLQAVLSIDQLDASAISFLRQRLDQPWVVACSGGADSTCLALAVAECFPEHVGPLIFAHFNHGLRGGESNADQTFVEELAGGLGITVESGHGRGDPDQPSEALLRDERHAFLQKVCENAGAEILLLGHHLDDVAETMIMRLTRGSGVEGLAAPRPVHRVNDVWRVRPLLSLSRVEIRETLQNAGIPWREDASNEELGPFRNRVRQKVLPEILEAAPNEALPGFKRSRDLLEEDARALDAWSTESFDKILRKDGSLDAQVMRTFPYALMRRMLRAWLGGFDASDALSARAFDDLLCEIAAGGVCKRSLARNQWVETDDQKVSFVESGSSAKGWGPCALPAGGCLFLPDSGVLRMDSSLGGEDARQALSKVGVDEGREALLDADSLESPLTVRTWLPGDRYLPLGAPGTRKLQDLFTDRKVPATRRGRLPVILAGRNRIAWCPGLPPAECCRITPRTGTVLRLTFEVQKPSL